MNDQPNYDPIITRARAHLANLAIGDEFHWRSLFGDEEWTEIRRNSRPQSVGQVLSREFSEGDDPIIEFVRVRRAGRKSIWRKIREVDGRD